MQSMVLLHANNHFSTYTEKKLNPNGLYHAIHNYNLARGVSKTSVHLLRHTYVKHTTKMYFCFCVLYLFIQF